MRNKSSIVFILAALLVAVTLVLPAAAQRGDDSERASKNGKTEGTVGGVDVTLEYGRPKVKDRQIWGDLVPYGEVWRTGADEATTLTLGSDAQVEGQALAAGTYSLFTIPGEDGWTVIFNKVAKQWGAYNYDSGEDALRVEVKPAGGDHVEEMDFVLEGDQVVLRWEKLRVPFTVEAAS